MTGERFRPAHWADGQPILASTSRVANIVEKQRLAATYGAGLVDMEAATVARIASGRSMPFYCFKAVSDEANDKLPDFDRFIEQGQLKMGPFLLNLAMHPALWASMVRLGRNSRKSARSLSDAIYDWLDEHAYIRKSTGDYTEGGRR
jgi:adenosylhomocysteine nucleosidase